MTYLIGIIAIAAIGYAVVKLLPSFGKAKDNSTGTPHSPRDDQPGDLR
jgi:hypothetical protein